MATVVPAAKVYIAFDSGYATPAASRTWTDVTSYVEGEDPIQISRGRADELSEVEPSRCTLTLDNSDGRFSPGYASGAYYPNVKKGRPLKVAVVYTNMVPSAMGNGGSFDTNITNWTAYTNCSVSRVTTPVQAGAGALSMSSTASGTMEANSPEGTSGIPVTAATTYTFVAYSRTASSTRSTSILVNWFNAAGSYLSTSVGAASTNSTSYALRYLTDVAPANAAYASIHLRVASTGGASEVHYWDTVTMYPGTDTTGTYNRFTGYIDEWPIAWPEAQSTHSTVTITATSRLARLALGNELRSVIEEAFLVDNPVLFYPLTEDDDGTTNQPAANIAATSQPPLRKRRRGAIGDANVADVLFGAEDGPLTDGAVKHPNWAPPSANVGYYLRARGVAGLSGVTAIRIEGFFNVTDAENTRLQCMMTLGQWDKTAAGRDATGTGAYVKAWMASDGHIEVDLFTGSGSVYTMSTGASTFADGAVHYFLAQFETGVGSANGTGGLRIDSTLWSYSTVPVFSATFDYVTVGGDKRGSDLWVGLLSYVAAGTAALDSTQRTAHSHAGTDGYTGDTAGQRILRLSWYADVDSADAVLDNGNSTVVWQDTTGQTALDLMRAVESTENGVLFDGKDGTLYFYARGRRYLTTTNTFTLDCSRDDIGADLEPIFDDQMLRNDCTVTRAETPTGIPVESWRASNASSISDYGPYKEAVDSLAYTTGEVTDAAEWRVRKYAEPIVRVPTVTADVVNADDPTSWLLIGVSLDDRFRLSNLPTQAPASTLDVFIEGYTESISATGYTISYYVTPTSLFEVWVVQDATYGVYDTYPLAY